MRCDNLSTHDYGGDHKFQSLLGFLMRCDLRSVRIVIWIAERFQSLLGFLMRCDEPAAKLCIFGCGFQSLLGFLMRCDSKNGHVVTVRGYVSIPAGFSDALRQNSDSRTNKA